MLNKKKKNNFRNLFWFTLVELIVVITILGILGTVGFVNFQWYNKRARDSSRTSDIKNITNALDIYVTEKDYLPIPDNSVEIVATWIILWYQWYASDSVLDLVNFNEGGIDPLTSSPYTLYVNKNRNKSQLMGFFEERDDVWKISSSSDSKYAGLYPYVSWKSLGIMMDPAENKPINEVTAIISAWSLDIATTTDTYQSYISNDFQIQWAWEVLQIVQFASSPTPLSTTYPQSCDEILSSWQFVWNGDYTISTDWVTTTTTTCNLVTQTSVLTVWSSGEYEAPQVCSAETVTLNSHNYNIPVITYGQSYSNLASTAWNVSQNNWTFSFTISPSCNNWTIVPWSESETLVSCDWGYAQNWNVCEASWLAKFPWCTQDNITLANWQIWSWCNVTTWVENTDYNCYDDTSSNCTTYWWLYSDVNFAAACTSVWSNWVVPTKDMIEEISNVSPLNLQPAWFYQWAYMQLWTMWIMWTQSSDAGWKYIYLPPPNWAFSQVPGWTPSWSVLLSVRCVQDWWVDQSCTSTTASINGHDYTFPWIWHGTSTWVYSTTSVSQNNGTYNYSINVSCSNQSYVYNDWDETWLVATSCDSGYKPDGWSCTQIAFTYVSSNDTGYSLTSGWEIYKWDSIWGAVKMWSAFQNLNFTSVHSYYFTTCAIWSNNKVYCWWSWDAWQIWDWTTNYYTEPAQVLWDIQTKDTSIISKWRDYACAITTDGLLYCWWQSQYWRLWNGVDSSWSNPTPINVEWLLSWKTVTDVATSYSHTCAVTNDGKAYCWWGAYWGTHNWFIWDGTTFNKDVPTEVTWDLSTKTVVKVSVWSGHSCAVTSDWQAYCWGSNDWWQLGDGTQTHRASPVRVMGLLSSKTVTDISAWSFFTCAITSDNYAYCWGKWNGSFANANTWLLWDWTTNNSLIPVQVAWDLSSWWVSKLSTSLEEACAITTDNKLYCWWALKFPGAWNESLPFLAPINF